MPVLGPGERHNRFRLPCKTNIAKTWPIVNSIAAHRDGSLKDLKASLGSLLKEADPDSLRLLVKIARAVVR